MRKVKRWRFYCEFCKKSGASGGHMAKHERGCTRNPQRECGMCKAAKQEQAPTSELLAALESGGVEAVLALAQQCPACVVAAIHAFRVNNPLRGNEDDEYFEFDYKAHAERFWGDVNRRDDY